MRFTVPGTPVAKGRLRFIRSTGRTYTPAATVGFEGLVAHEASRVTSTLLEGPLSVDILAVMPRPKRLLRRKDPDGLIWCTSRPDADNVAKAVTDALNGIAYRDDAQVVDLTVRTVYAERDGQARTEVAIRPAGDVAT